MKKQLGKTRKPSVLSDEFANGAEVVGEELEEQREELGEKNGVFLRKLESQLAQRFELGGYVNGHVCRVHETREPFAGSGGGHGFSDHGSTKKRRKEKKKP